MMRTRVIRLLPIAAAAALPLVVKRLRDQAVQRNRAATPWLAEPADDRLGTPPGAPR